MLQLLKEEFNEIPDKKKLNSDLLIGKCGKIIIINEYFYRHETLSKISQKRQKERKNGSFISLIISILTKLHY